MINRTKQLQFKLVERCPLRNAIICSNLQLSSISSHFTEGYSGPLCVLHGSSSSVHSIGYMYLVSSVLLTSPTSLVSPHQPIPAVQQLCHTFYCTTCILKECSLLSLHLRSVSVADYVTFSPNDCCIVF